MTFKRLFLLISALLWSIAPAGKTADYTEAAPANLPSGTPVENPDPARDCPSPAMSRLRRHTVAQGETIESIARQYNVIPAALIGINPMLRGGRASPGSAIVIPPYSGIEVEVPAGWNWQKLAEAYKVRADLLFEANGCRPLGQTVFVPAVNRSRSGLLQIPMQRHRCKDFRYPLLRLKLCVTGGNCIRSAANFFSTAA